MNNDVWVVAEHFRGKLNEITFELLGKGREVAQAIGGKLSVLLLGNQVGGLVLKLGATDAVQVAEHVNLSEFTSDAYGAVLQAALGEARPRLLLLGSTSVGLDLLSLLSARLGLPCIDNCISLDTKDGRLLAGTQLFGGKILAEVVLPEETTLLAVVPGTFTPEAGKVEGKPEIRTLTVPESVASNRTTFLKLIEPPPGDVDITTVPLLVAVGRGIQNDENLLLAEELAAALGGAVCASRPIIDQGWLPLTRQVGKSGMTVKPKLYLALGISGAPEHLEGMKQSEMIVAINTDSNAPIFGAAHYGAVTDAVDLLPLLTEEVRKASMKKAS